MAKRGETRPWRVTFKWDSGVRGTITCSTEDEAQDKAQAIRDNAARMDGRTVEVTVKHRDA